jgi:hypothetical protein
VSQAPHRYHIVILKDPGKQYRFNVGMCWAWGLSMLGILFVPTFRGEANLPALLIMEVSLWANFATHFGALSGCVAAMRHEEPDPEPVG